MSNKTIAATLSYYLEAYLVTSTLSTSILVPIPYRDGVVKCATMPLEQAGFFPDETAVVCYNHGWIYATESIWDHCC